MRRVLVATGLAFLGAGCQPAPPADPQGMPPGTTTLVEASSAFLNITPAAQVQIWAVLSTRDKSSPWRLRVTIVPGGCHGQTAKLDLDPDPVASGDSESFVGGFAACTGRTKSP